MIIVPSPEGLICVCYSSGCSGCSRLWQLTKAELKKKKKVEKKEEGGPTVELQLRIHTRLIGLKLAPTGCWGGCRRSALANLLGPFPGKLCGITGGSSLTEWWDFRPRSAGREVLAAAGPGCGCADAEAVQPWCFYNPMNSRGRTHVSSRFIYQLIISIKLCPH